MALLTQHVDVYRQKLFVNSGRRDDRIETRTRWKFWSSSKAKNPQSQTRTLYVLHDVRRYWL